MSESRLCSFERMQSASGSLVVDQDGDVTKIGNSLNKDSDESLKIYRPPNDEDIYVPPGRKRYDRDDLRPPEDEINLGPPAVDNDDLYR